ncbi:MAG TPA: VWA domain-containing protein, partial [Campylobacteraceae bacterium]|nr:VWA domain-containing protein [Campylobacteraceae bacterium]
MTLLYPKVLILLLAALYLYRLQPSQKRLPLVLALMIVALSRPVVFKTAHEKKMEATEAVIALDLSWSMRAGDIVPSRLEAAKRAIKKVISESPQNRYALFGFTTNPLILSPYTSDTRLLAEAIDAVEAENILTKGTSIEKLLRYLAKQKIPVTNLILFTDGGEERDAAALAEIAKKAGIKIIVVGVASRHGAMLRDSFGKTLKNEEGALVVSRLNPMLPKLASLSGGLFVPFTTPDETAHAVLEALDEIAQKSRFSQSEAGYKELFWIPLLAALLLFLFHFVEIPRKIWLLLP